MRTRNEGLAAISRRFDIDTLHVFGSRAEEVAAWVQGDLESLDHGPSDVDIGVKKRHGLSFSVAEMVDLAQTLEAYLGVARVDLGDLARVGPYVALEIIRGKRLYAADRHRADEYELYVLRRAGDLAPLERERRDLVMRKRA